MSSWRKQPLPMKTAYESDLSSGEAGIDGRPSIIMSQRCSTPPRPRYLEVPSEQSFQSISSQRLSDYGVPDFDETESSDVFYNDDDCAHEKIEVAAGVFMRLRGSQETQEAWDRGECIETTCFVCDIQLACVRDCDSVICPECRLVSPVDVRIPLGRGPRGDGAGVRCGAARDVRHRGHGRERS